MKVRVVFDFSEEQLRTIRAAFKRGGKATRKEASYFVNRAMTAAFAAAPTPAPARRKRPKPEPPKAPAVLTEDQEQVADRDKRLAIRKMYRLSPEGT